MKIINKIRRNIDRTSILEEVILANANAEPIMQGRDLNEFYREVKGELSEQNSIKIEDDRMNEEIGHFNNKIFPFIVFSGAIMSGTASYFLQTGETNQGILMGLMCLGNFTLGAYTLSRGNMKYYRLYKKSKE